MSGTEIKFIITIEGMMLGNDPLPKEEAEAIVREDVLEDWKPISPKEGEYTDVSVEMEYSETNESGICPNCDTTALDVDDDTITVSSPKQETEWRQCMICEGTYERSKWVR